MTTTEHRVDLDPKPPNPLAPWRIRTADGTEWHAISELTAVRQLVQHVECRLGEESAASGRTEGPWMDAWKSPSGRLHLRPSCSGAGPRSRMKRVRVTAKQFEDGIRCRCLPDFRADPLGRGGRLAP